ncbi:MAG: ABC transporter permease subunit [Thermoplasmata archaeon]
MGPDLAGIGSASDGSRSSGPSSPPPRTALPTPSEWSRSARRSAILYLAIVVAAVPATVATIGLSGSTLLSNLPTASVDLLYSFCRMLAAYAASLGFALAYGYFAATRRTGERVMIPVLDILQSIPILGFFPVAIVFFVAVFGPNDWLGPNVASVFLIFTAMTWNMVFGVYESLKSMPSDLREAADSFGSSGVQRMRRVVFPATVNRLVYNSILSWTGGWFFLVEAEIFTTSSGGQPLAGIGSYLSIAAGAGNGEAFLAGLIPLVLLIVAMDFLLWRPLGHIAERYRYDTSPSGENEVDGAARPTRVRRAATIATRAVRAGVVAISTPFAQLAAFTSRARRRERPRARTAIGWVALGAVLIFVWLILIAIGVAVYGIYTQPIAPSVIDQMWSLPLAMGASLLRVLAAFALCLAIALPLAIALARPSRHGRVGLPIIEVISSIPATALFPVVVFQLVPYISPEGASIVMLMTGMIWYLFFNLLAGLRSVPPDLEEAARSFGVEKRSLLRKVLLPGSFAAFVTGAITAFGGGWNTLIVAEYLNIQNGPTFHVFGVGYLLDIGYSEPSGVNGLPLMVAALFTLVATVVVINELVWKPLYRRATTKYRYD